MLRYLAITSQIKRPLQLKGLSSAYHATTVTARRMKSPRKFIPEDWYIVEAGPGGGTELNFGNQKTKQATWFTPEGMTAEEILAIPDAKKYWSTLEEVKEYVEEKAAEKKAGSGRDLIDDLREYYGEWKEEKKEATSVRWTTQRSKRNRTLGNRLTSNKARTNSGSGRR